MDKACDHTSVGMFVWKDEKLLLIERARPPYGFAIPAGHVDGDASYEDAAKRELFEEVGLTAESLELVGEGRKDTACRRGGAWHYWKLYRVTTSGEVKRSEAETKRAGWYSMEEVRTLAARTKQYLNKEIAEEEWEKEPGLEAVMYDWFKELHIID